MEQISTTPSSLDLTASRKMVSVAAVTERINQLERQRRQQIVTPAATTTLILLLLGYVPALTPTPALITLGWLTVALLLCGIAILLNQAQQTPAAITAYMIGVLIFFGGAVLFSPTGPNHALSYTSFAAGNLYYLILGILPLFAAILLFENPWPYLINVIILIVPQVCIWALPHDASFTAFVNASGGQVFWSASIAAGQILLFVFALATARSFRNMLIAALDLEAINQRIAERQRSLESDISRLQQSHAQMANGEPVRINLSPTSELYPLGVSMNLMGDRLSKLAQSNQDLQQLQWGLNEAARIVRQMGQGDLTAQPTPTGTMVDGLIASLIQVQGQIAAWIDGVARAVRETGASYQQAIHQGADLVMALRQIEELARLNPDPALADLREVVGLARKNAEQMHELLQSSNMRQRQVAESVERIRFVGTPSSLNLGARPTDGTGSFPRYRPNTNPQQ